MVSKSLHYTLLGQNFCLLPEKALFWQEENMLILADIHLGKAGHFRKAGFAVPRHVHLQDLTTLESVINSWYPTKILIIGDLFHSQWNQEWLLFSEWLQPFSTSIQWLLVRGNHDILPASIYQQSVFQIFPDCWLQPPFLFTHEPARSVAQGWYNICGHLHPSVRLNGRGRQQLILPCFCFGSQRAILPAFGKFTGTATIQTQAGDAVFVITPGAVTRIC
ncbi:MAG: ligase-associated DNA damage response endonuclease PdeM [Cytophagales bacterium]|nr:ligase-associated DNA damage response endonuclease PdeM [Bernardetiaceae bacterium]MDW8203838.1 ligase-associated DNA damage response endonuclease PdeM [Cytophagales bacterium]